MRVWKKGWRGASFEVRLPDTLRRRRTPVQPFEPAPTPSRSVPLVRDPQSALNFLRDPALAGDGKSPNPQAQRYLEDAGRQRREASTLAERVALIPWYHTIELGDGIVTPGSHDHRRFVHEVGIPQDLTGQRVLDVATFDGFWAFEFERRGAEVVAVDIPSMSGMDWPAGAREILVAEALDVPQGEAFAIAKQALGSSVHRRPCSVYDVTPEMFGSFDVIFVGDLLLHLRDPLRALCQLRKVAAGRLILVDRYEPAISGTGETLLRYRGGWEGMEWWAPSLETLVQWVVDAGFHAPEVRGSYRVRGVNRHEPGWQRAVIHARI